MQLRGARLCLDCEELHTEDRCPACASDAFAFLTRWIPVADRRTTPRPPRRQEPSSNGGGGTASKLMTGGAMGLVLVAAGRWLWKATKPEPPSSDRPTS